jgi:hypothetical protein
MTTFIIDLDVRYSCPVVRGLAGPNRMPRQLPNETPPLLPLWILMQAPHLN